MIQDVLKLIEEKESLKNKLETVSNELKDAVNNLDLNEFDNYDYESARHLSAQVQYLIDDERGKRLSDIVAAKKVLKYPQLLKPTYYPEIDTLNISDEEKLRLDKAAYMNIRYYMSVDNLDRLEYKISIEDLELLKSIGVAEKRYSFRCKECGDSCITISESDLEKYKRVFKLEGMGNSLTDELEKEFDELYEQGFCCISICCMECDFDYEITNQKVLDDYRSHMKELYKVVKNPDLTFEKL
ncbi:hypothetical protein LXJ15735_27570 [Lacrimispora xylanolytica]